MRSFVPLIGIALVLPLAPAQQKTFAGNLPLRRESVSSRQVLHDPKTGIDFSESDAREIDDDALMLLAKHLAAVGPGDWSALQASGQVTLSTEPTTHPADLLLNGIGFARLVIHDHPTLLSITFQNEQRVTRMTHRGTTVDVSGQGPECFLAYQLIRSPLLSERLLSLKNAGTVQIAGSDVLKVTMRVASESIRRANAPTKESQLDLYFDPKTFLLRWSANRIRPVGSAVDQLQVTSFSDYRMTSDILLPSRISQTLGGTPVWDLQLSDMQVVPALAPDLLVD